MATSRNAMRARKLFQTTITFTGAAGAGAVGTVAVATMTGAIMVHSVGAYCSTSLAGATATVEMGVSGDTAELIAQTTATDIDAGEVWESATPDEGVALVTSKAIAGNIIITVATADVTAGVLKIAIEYTPLTTDGYLA